MYRRYNTFTIRIISQCSLIWPSDVPMVKHFYHPLHIALLDKYGDPKRKLHYIIHMACRRTSYKKGSAQVNKTPAQAFTPPAEKKIGTKWALCITAQVGNMKSGYSKIFNVTRAITRPLTREFLLK